MIKMITLVKRNPNLSREEFEEHWRNVHARKVRELPEVSIHMRRYVQNYMTGGNAEAADDFGGVGVPSDDLDFDGIIEAWFDSMEDMTRMATNETYLEHILPDDHHLTDMAACKMYLVEENVVLDVDDRPPAESQTGRAAPR